MGPNFNFLKALALCLTLFIIQSPFWVNAEDRPDVEEVIYAGLEQICSYALNATWYGYYTPAYRVAQCTLLEGFLAEDHVGEMEFIDMKTNATIPGLQVATNSCIPLIVDQFGNIRGCTNDTATPDYTIFQQVQNYWDTMSSWWMTQPDDNTQPTNKPTDKIYNDYIDCLKKKLDNVKGRRFGMPGATFLSYKNDSVVELLIISAGCFSDKGPLTFYRNFNIGYVNP